MSTDPDRLPSTQPLSPAELELEADVLTDPDKSSINELETFLALQTMLLEKAELLLRQRAGQDEFDELGILMMATAQQFARAVNTEQTAAEIARYAAVLLTQALRELNALCHKHGGKLTGASDEDLLNLLPEQLQQALESIGSDETFDMLEKIYGASCTAVINSLIDQTR